MPSKPRGQLSSQDIKQMKEDLWDTSVGNYYDITRKVKSRDSLGGVSFTMTAIATVYMDVQDFTVESILRDQQVMRSGGLQIEADYKCFLDKNVDIREEDRITPDSGTTQYEVKLVHNLWEDHKEAFLKKIS